MNVRESREAFAFGYGVQPVVFTPPAHPPDAAAARQDLVDLQRLVSRPEDANYAQRVLYEYAHCDPERVATYKSLLSILGSPYDSLGMLQAVDGMPAEVRSEAVGFVLEQARRFRGDTVQLAACTLRLSRFEKLRQPAEAFTTFHRGMEAMQSKLHGMTDYEEAERCLQRMALDRLPGDSLEASWKRFLQLYEGCRSCHHAAAILSQVYREATMLPGPLLAAFPPGTSPSQACDACVALTHDAWLALGLPANEGSRFINLAVSQRKPGETLPQCGRRLADEYLLTGQFFGREKFDRELQEAVKDAVDPAEMSLDVERRVRVRRLLGDAPEVALQKALREMSQAPTCIALQPTSVAIDGLSLPRRVGDRV